MRQKQRVERLAIDTIVGPLIIDGDENHVHTVTFCHPGEADEWRKANPSSPVLREAQTQLEEYFRGERCHFDLPLLFSGTDFQERVWRALAEIDYGHTLSYGQLANKLGNVHLARAVGQAANKNPLPIIIPCHRLVGSGGWIGGFAPGVSFKRILLEHENAGVDD